MLDIQKKKEKIIRIWSVEVIIIAKWTVNINDEDPMNKLWFNYEKGQQWQSLCHYLQIKMIRFVCCLPVCHISICLVQMKDSNVKALYK